MISMPYVPFEPTEAPPLEHRPSLLEKFNKDL